MIPRPAGLHPTYVKQPNSYRICGTNIMPSRVAAAMIDALQNSFDFPQSLVQTVRRAMLEASGRSPPHRRYLDCLCSWSSLHVELWRKEV